VPAPAPFTPTDDEIKALRDGDLSRRELGRRYGVDHKRVGRYLTGPQGTARLRKIHTREVDAEAKRRRRARQAAQRAGTAPTDDRPELALPSDGRPRHMQPQQGTGRIMRKSLRRLNGLPGSIPDFIAARPRGWATTPISRVGGRGLIRMFPPPDYPDAVPDRGRAVEQHEVVAYQAKGWRVAEPQV